MNTKEDFAQYSIFELLQLLWNYYSNILNLAWEKNVLPIFFFFYIYKVLYRNLS